jgi:hypothetical protein
MVIVLDEIRVLHDFRSSEWFRALAPELFAEVGDGRKG